MGSLANLDASPSPLLVFYGFLTIVDLEFLPSGDFTKLLRTPCHNSHRCSKERSLGWAFRSTFWGLCYHRGLRGTRSNHWRCGCLRSTRGAIERLPCWHSATPMQMIQGCGAVAVKGVSCGYHLGNQSRPWSQSPVWIPSDVFGYIMIHRQVRFHYCNRGIERDVEVSHGHLSLCHSFWRRDCCQHRSVAWSLSMQ